MALKLKITKEDFEKYTDPYELYLKFLCLDCQVRLEQLN